MTKRSFIDFCYLAICLLYTKFCYRSSRLLRLPIDIRNKHSISFGKNLTTGRNCRIEAYSKDQDKVLFLGDNIEINDNVHITASQSVVIGNNVLMASRIYISDTSHGSYIGNQNDSHPDIFPKLRSLFCNSVKIEDNVWIGEGVSILPGSNIGKGAIIGANSVVKGKIPSYSIAVGVPAKIIKQFNFDNKKWERLK